MALSPEETSRPTVEAGGVEFPVLTFESGLPGFPDQHRFAVVPLGPEFEPFCRMTSLDTEGLQFVVAPPGVFFDDYTIEVDEASAERLGVSDAADVVVLVIVTLAEPPAVPTANLLGPIVVNRLTWSAMQVVQRNSVLPVAAALQRRSVH